MAAKILIVDDSISIRKMVEFALKSRKYAVRAAVDGQEGLEMLESGEHFDMVILDINMPRMDGLTLLHTMRQKTEWLQIPVLILTTEGEESDRDQAIRSGATDYRVKPFKPAELLEQVARLLEKK
jgi:two-component system, chemotaxis family, chemotaxis protein CheY